MLKGLVEGKQVLPVIEGLIIEDHEGLNFRIFSQFLDGRLDESSPLCVKDDEFALGMDKAMTERFKGQPTRGIRVSRPYLTSE